MKWGLFMRSRLKGILKGTLFSAVLTILFSVFLATVMYFCNFPGYLSEICICLIGALSCAAGGFAVSKANGSRGLLMGGAVGILYFVLLMLVSLCVMKNIYFTTHNTTMLALSVFSGMLGGVLAMPRE